MIHIFGIIFGLLLENNITGTMKKIILHTGLLFFFLSAIFFSQRGFSIPDILLKSFIVFLMVSIMLSFLAIVLFKSVKREAEKEKDVSTNLLGNNNE